MSGSLTEHQYRTLEKIRGGLTLCCEMTEEGRRWFLDGEGAVGPATAEAIVGSGLVQPTGDGMFGTTQTYRPVALRQAQGEGAP